MSATFKWVIEWMQCRPQEGSYTDVVITAGWRCTAVESSGGSEYSSGVYGTCAFSQPSEGGQFTPYADLTQDQVLDWCWASGLNKNETEAGLQKAIDIQINPPVIQPPLPWATPAA